MDVSIWDDEVNDILVFLTNRYNTNVSSIGFWPFDEDVTLRTCRQLDATLTSNRYSTALKLDEASNDFLLALADVLSDDNCTLRELDVQTRNVPDFLVALRGSRSLTAFTLSRRSHTHL